MLTFALPSFGFTIVKKLQNRDLITLGTIFHHDGPSNTWGYRQICSNGPILKLVMLHDGTWRFSVTGYMTIASSALPRETDLKLPFLNFFMQFYIKKLSYHIEVVAKAVGNTSQVKNVIILFKFVQKKTNKKSFNEVIQLQYVQL